MSLMGDGKAKQTNKTKLLFRLDHGSSSNLFPKSKFPVSLCIFSKIALLFGPVSVQFSSIPRQRHSAPRPPRCHSHADTPLLPRLPRDTTHPPSSSAFARFPTSSATSPAGPTPRTRGASACCGCGGAGPQGTPGTARAWSPGPGSAVVFVVCVCM